MAGFGSIEDFFNPDYMTSKPVMDWAKKLDTKQEVSVSDRYKNRLDNLSHDLYGTTELWWIIAIINEIVNPMDFKNSSLKVPYLEDVISGLNDLRDKVKKD